MSASWSDQRKSSGTPVARVHFTAQDCGSCPVREKCTKAANGKWGRSLTLLPRGQQEALEARRREQLTDEWQQRYNIRAGVAGTISQAVRRTRIRRTRYTGLPKTHLGHVFAATAINVIRLAGPATPACPRPTSATSSPPPPSTSSDSTPGSPKPHSARPGPRIWPDLTWPHKGPAHTRFTDFPTESFRRGRKSIACAPRPRQREPRSREVLQISVIRGSLRVVQGSRSNIVAGVGERGAPRPGARLRTSAV
ncbi:transposase [Streptomyces sp. NBC_01614]|uniref:transposase n=1 Tax=Streptomyces sp. NBC_01614 TaxID=2975897 RepID=UPI003863302C